MEAALIVGSGRGVSLSCIHNSPGYIAEALTANAKRESPMAFAWLLERYRDRVVRVARTFATNGLDGEGTTRGRHDRKCGTTSLNVVIGLLVFLLSAIPALSQVPASQSQDSPAKQSSDSIFQRQYLLGDWGGERTALAEKGINFDFFYISDMQANPSGGLQQTQAGWMRVRGTVDINFDKMIEWQGLSFLATGLWQSGVNLGAKIGTLANPSDLVSAHATRLDSFWLQQLFLNNKLRVRAGQLAGLDFYGNQDDAGSFLIEPLG